MRASNQSGIGGRLVKVEAVPCLRDRLTIGKETARILIVFNTGHYQPIDLTQWIAGQSPDILATNFGVAASVFDKFPKKDVFMTK
ncbi:MAG: hypothetical protein ACKOEG_13960 [Chthoniobacterales bacterium]